MIRGAHNVLVKAGIRQEVTLLGSGGIIAAEHIPKAILCGLDAVALDTPVMVALQADFEGECKERETSQFTLPNKLTVDWGAQRLMNLAAAWRDQLLEISGAMGLREVRRMRGEMGRAMFMKDLEANAFAGVVGYERA
jgi:glutamate synthase domain-containing protein 2